MSDTSDQIATNSQSPKRAEGDGESAEQHSIPDQIKADQYQRATKIKKGLGFRSVQLRPGNNADF